MRRGIGRALLSAALAMALAAGAGPGAAEEGILSLPADLSGGAPIRAERSADPEVYEDPTIRAELHMVGHRENEYNVTYFYATVTIGHASQLRTASADRGGFLLGGTAPARTIAGRVNAVLALDGDFCDNYHLRERKKYCLRQGVVYRDTVTDYLDMLLIDEDGDFHIYPAGPELAGRNKEEIGGKKIINAFQFGPALVIDGEPVADEAILDRAHSPATSEPDSKAARMCIGQTGPLQYLVLTNWYGLNLAQLRDLALSIAPCRTLYVLDGGNSAQLVWLKGQVNRNETNGRDITDIIYFASAYFGDAE